MNSSDLDAAAFPSERTSPLEWVRTPERMELLLEDIAEKLRRKKRRRTRAAGAVAAGLLVLLAVAWGVPWVRSTTSALTATAQRERLRLADGSVAVLNASTRLRTDFRHGRRVVELESGEAFFSVVKDKAHPFYVRTPRGVVRVTGTAFNVRLTEEAAPEVTLIEGGVSVTGLGPERRLVPGQQFDPRSGNVQTLTPVRLAAAIAWREGRLVLDGLTLGEAAGRMADFHGKKILIAPQVAGLTMGGSCSLDDLPAFLEFLPRALSVSVLPTSDGSWRVMARQ